MLTNAFLESLAARYKISGRVNDPAEYIAYLRSQPRFKRWPLTQMPKYGIVLHDTRVDDALSRVGYSESDYTAIQTGTTDPNLLYIVESTDGAPSFILNRGLPGAGGIATQVGELAALGVEYIVHIGTCGLVGQQVPPGEIIVAQASYKDAAAALLLAPDGSTDPLAYADPTLSTALVKTVGDTKHSYGPVGYTIPIFYFQPIDLVRQLLDGGIEGGPPIGYFEMEQASLFAMCTLMNVAGSSMVVGSDRYTLVNGQLHHEFEDFDQHAAETKMLQTAIATFGGLTEARTASYSTGLRTAAPLIREL